MADLAREHDTLRVSFRPVTEANFADCVALDVSPSQRKFVATTLESLAQAATDPNLTALLIYPGTSVGLVQPRAKPVGFAMYEVAAGVGYIQRLLIDRAHQRRGYGRAALRELLRRLRLIPEVQVIATSHKHRNRVVARLFASEGFVEWKTPWRNDLPDETFRILRDPRG